MFSVEKIREFSLIMENRNCQETIGIKECPSGRCKKCTILYKEEHEREIIKSQDFDCADCDNNRFKLGLDNDPDFRCRACKELIKEKLEENFKTIFNKLGEGNV